MGNKQVEIVPSIQIMELMTPLAGQYDVADIADRLLQYNFYGAIETATVSWEQAERLKKLCCAQGVRWTCWASLEQNGEHLNLSSLDHDLRAHSTQRIIELMRQAGAQGADAFAFLSGPMPEDARQLPQAITAFEHSFQEIAQAAEEYPEMELLLEPLDRWIHKKNVIGPTREAKHLLLNIRKIHARTYMAWDSAHTMLNGEDLVTSLRIAGESICQLHLCNAILDEEDAMYGDYHIPPDEAGYLTLLRSADTIHEAARLPLERQYLPVAIEARPQKGETPLELEKRIRAFLAEAIRLAEYEVNVE